MLACASDPPDAVQDPELDPATDAAWDEPVEPAPTTPKKRKRRGERGGGEAPQPPEADEPTPSPSPSPGSGPGPAPSGIEDLGGDSWRVQQSLVNRWQDNPDELAQAIQVSGGLEIRHVRSRDGYHLGLRNKDVVQTINGYGVSSTPAILVALAALKNAKKVDVVLSRDGEKLKHHYEIR